MTMEKQKDNPKFSFLFGGEFYSYYKCKLALEQQQRESSPVLWPHPREIPFSDSSAAVLQTALFWVSCYLKTGPLGLSEPICCSWACSERLLSRNVMENEVIDLPLGSGSGIFLLCRCDG